MLETPSICSTVQRPTLLLFATFSMPDQCYLHIYNSDVAHLFFHRNKVTLEGKHFECFDDELVADPVHGRVREDDLRP